MTTIQSKNKVTAISFYNMAFLGNPKEAVELGGDSN
ncbi:hypothetical protein PDPUS_1_01545 [Photobacterium damselae subsp. piscicida]|uniref:Uncharacterized protein n=1 Tax=Photobacterium damsela subsp. piscicida TaxID=38294 RepID=A0AAD1CF04_PHODP|nr:hypothetical protein PDPUS_1_01545 [Photobacterium damselae subsp. piscicida]GAW45432.1 hypothetical protein PDPJ_1_02847 [Photobacterium damselae subsp. piscicida]